MPATDLPLLIDAARAAGDIAMEHLGREPVIWRKPDASPVSAADLAVDEALGDALRTARPAYGWLSEETPDSLDRMSARHCFIVDPIDGTHTFLDGQANWAVSLAVAEAGEITAGVVHMPARGLTYTASRRQGAHLNGARLTVAAKEELRGATVLASKPTWAVANWKDRVPEVSRQFRSSMAYRLALVAQGRFDAMMTLKLAWEWDIAAGSLIAAEAGARVTDRSGGPLRFNSRGRRTDGIVAACPRLHAAIVGALA